jgi:hypothetical protein
MVGKPAPPPDNSSQSNQRGQPAIVPAPSRIRGDRCAQLLVQCASSLRHQFAAAGLLTLKKSTLALAPTALIGLVPMQVLRRSRDGSFTQRVANIPRCADEPMSGDFAVDDQEFPKRGLLPLHPGELSREGFCHIRIAQRQTFLSPVATALAVQTPNHIGSKGKIGCRE